MAECGGFGSSAGDGCEGKRTGRSRFGRGERRSERRVPEEGPSAVPLFRRGSPPEKVTGKRSCIRRRDDHWSEGKRAKIGVRVLASPHVFLDYLRERKSLRGTNFECVSGYIGMLVASASKLR